MSSRVRLLLGLAAILAAMRFVVVPWTEAQDDMHDRPYAITRQLDRPVAIVEAGSALQARREALAAIVREPAARAPLAIPGSGRRVPTLTQVRAAVDSAGHKVKVRGWVLDGEIETAGLLFGRVRLQLEGPLRNVAEAHVGIESGLPHVFVRNLIVNVRRGGRQTGIANATLELDLYLSLITT